MGVQAGTPIARLGIEMYAEIARLQDGINQAKRLVGGASALIAKEVRASNDNLSSLGVGASAGMKRFSQDVQEAAQYLGRLARSSDDAATRINALTGVTGGIRRSADDIAAYGAELDRLRGKYNPVFAAIQQHRQSLEEIRRAQAVGAISAEEMGAAISRSRQQTLASIDAIKGRTVALREAQQAAAQAARQEEAYAAAAAGLRGQLDPMFAAQQRFNQAMDQADDLLRVGAITSREYAAAQKFAREALQDHAQAVMGTRNAVDDLSPAVAKASGNARQFSLQMSQVGQQVMAGTSVVQAFAMQLPDIAAGMNANQASANRFAAFLSGPWGIATTAAIGLVATFAVKLLDQGDAVKKAVDELRKDAAATDAAAQAKAIFGKTLEGVTAAIREQNAALKESQTTSRQAELDAYAQAEARRVSAVRIRTETIALLEQQKVLAENARSQNIFAGGPGGAQSIVANQYAAEVERIEKRLKQSQADIKLAEETVRRAEIPINQRAVAESIDAAAAATGRYERSLQSLNNQRARGTISQREYIEQERRAQTIRDAAIKAAQEAGNKPRGPTAAERRIETLAREAVAIDTLIAGLYRSAEAYGTSTAAGIRARVEAEALEKGIKRQADAQDYAAQQLRKFVAEQVNGYAEQVAAMRDQTRAQEFVNKAVAAGQIEAEDASEALSNMLEQQKLMTAMAVAQSIQDTKGYDAAKEALQKLTDAQLANIAARKQAADLQRAAQINRQIEDVQLETKLTRDLGAARVNAMRGLSGDALDDELARIAAEHEKIAIQARAEAEAADLVKLGYDDAAAAVMRKAEADKTQVDATLEIEKQIRAVEILNDRTDALSGALSNMKGLGPLGDIMGVLTSKDPSRALLGMGGLGTLAGLFTGGGQEAYIKQAQVISDGITKVFPQLSKEMAGAIGSAIQGAGIGMTAAKSIFGEQSGAQKMGSAIGGALGGSKVVEKALGKGMDKIFKGLGDFAGPLGSIAGGLLGSALGGLLKSNRSASANITGANSVNVSGKDRGQYGAAGDLAGSVTSGLKQIADAFGATLGSFQVAIGTRGDEIRVNTSGNSLKGKNGGVGFGDDAEAAARYAILDAINDGALKGMREGSLRLLKAGDDLDAALQKATSFENVFAELRNATDPTGYALEQLEKQFASLRTIFDEAGASAAEYADLERLLSIRREEVMSKERDALEDIRSRIAEVQGDDATVRAIERQRELKDAMSDTVRAELERLYAIEDMTRVQQESAAAAQAAAEAQKALADAQAEATRAAQEEEQRLANSLLDLRSRLAEVQGNDALVQQIASTRELDGAQTDLERSLIRQIHAAQTAAQAQADLEAAQEKAAAAADRLSSLQIRLFNAQGNTAAARQLEQQLELVGAQSDAERAMLQQIHAAERATEAAEAQARAQEEARNAMVKSYQDQASALEKTLDTFRRFEESIRDFREGLFSADQGMMSFEQIRAQFQRTSAMAQMGNEDSLGRFVGDARSYLDAARNQAGSLTEYQAIVAQVAAASRRAEAGAGGVANAAQTQISYYEQQIKQLETIDKNTVAVTDALTDLLELQRDETTPLIVESFQTGTDKLAELLASSEDRRAAAEERLHERLQMIQVDTQATALNTGTTSRRLTSWDRGGRVSITSDDALNVFTVNPQVIVLPADNDA